MWERRQRKVKVFGRINMVPLGTKVFYLRLLLTHVEVPTSFDDLLSFQEVVHPTFKAACIARRLLQDDGRKGSFEPPSNQRSSQQLRGRL